MESDEYSSDRAIHEGKGRWKGTFIRMKNRRMKEDGWGEGRWIRTSFWINIFRSRDEHATRSWNDVRRVQRSFCNCIGSRATRTFESVAWCLGGTPLLAMAALRLLAQRGAVISRVETAGSFEPGCTIAFCLRRRVGCVLPTTHEWLGFTCCRRTNAFSILVAYSLIELARQLDDKISKGSRGSKIWGKANERGKIRCFQACFSENLHRYD